MSVELLDASEWLKRLEPDSVDLIATDPPYGTGRKFDSYSDSLLMLETLRQAIRLMHRALKRTGSLYIQCDWRLDAHLRLALDSQFGPSNFRNQIIWKRTVSRNYGRSFGRMHDVILYYTRSDEFTFNHVFKPLKDGGANHYVYDDGDGRGPYRFDSVTHTYDGMGHVYDLGFGERTPAKGYRMREATARDWIEQGLLDVRPGYTPRKRFYLSESEGARIGSVWDDIQVLNSQSSERTGYSTQKPLALYERIISASSNPSDLVIDPFAGSGTTLVAAKRLGRRFAGCDVNREAVGIANRRLDELLV